MQKVFPLPHFGAFLLLAVSAVSFAQPVCKGQSSPHIVSMGPKATVVVAEGPCEARSMGSYTVRLYADSLVDFKQWRSLSDFKGGLIRARDGFISQLKAVNTTAGRRLIVTIETAGSGLSSRQECYRVNRQTVALVSCGLDSRQSKTKSSKKITQ